jgi:kynurenine formamidase
MPTTTADNNEGSRTVQTPGIPTQDQVLGYFSQLSNWGRWGEQDVLGTLNLIDAACSAAALQLAASGRVVSCCWPIDTEIRPGDRVAPQRFMIKTGQGLPIGELGEVLDSSASEFLGIASHGRRITHLDGLSHFSYNAQMYNGVPADRVTSDKGATAHDVTSAAKGIITRGVLLDVPAFRGVEWLEPDDFVTPEEITAILARHGIELRAGDALLLRTGLGRRISQGDFSTLGESKRASWHAACLPLFHDSDIAVIAADAVNENAPSGYPSLSRPVHTIGITALGLWLVDNCDFEELARTCAELGRYEFAFVVSALPFTGATGSPVNPLAIF